MNKLIDHVIGKSARTPRISKEEMEKRQCAWMADELKILQADYERRRSDYDFKNAHPIDAAMEECNLHWKEWVCLKRGGSDNGVSYASQWNESAQELRRKLVLEYEALSKLEQQIQNLKGSACPSPVQ